MIDEGRGVDAMIVGVQGGRSLRGGLRDRGEQRCCGGPPAKTF